MPVNMTASSPPIPVVRRYYLARLERRVGLCVSLSWDHVMLIVWTWMWVWTRRASELPAATWTWKQAGRLDILWVRPWTVALGWIRWRQPHETDIYFGPLHWNTIFPRLTGEARPVG